LSLAVFSFITTAALINNQEMIDELNEIFYNSKEYYLEKFWTDDYYLHKRCFNDLFKCIPKEYVIRDEGRKLTKQKLIKETCKMLDDSFSLVVKRLFQPVDKNPSIAIGKWKVNDDIIKFCGDYYFGLFNSFPSDGFKLLMIALLILPPTLRPDIEVICTVIENNLDVLDSPITHQFTIEI